MRKVRSHCRFILHLKSIKGKNKRDAASVKNLKEAKKDENS